MSSRAQTERENSERSRPVVSIGAYMCGIVKGGSDMGGTYVSLSYQLSIVGCLVPICNMTATGKRAGDEVAPSLAA